MAVSGAIGIGYVYTALITASRINLDAKYITGWFEPLDPIRRANLYRIITPGGANIMRRP